MHDWRLVFTNAFRGKRTSKIINDIFGNTDEVVLTREHFEYLVVKVCSELMEEVSGSEFADCA